MCVFITNVCYPEHVLRGCVLQDMVKVAQDKTERFLPPWIRRRFVGSD